MNNRFIVYKSGCGRAVGLNESVNTEATVVIFFALVTAVEEFWLSVFCLACIQAVIEPFPNTAARQFRFLIKNIPIILYISRAVAHSVGVFAEEKRTLAVGSGVISIFKTVLRGSLHY